MSESMSESDLLSEIDELRTQLALRQSRLNAFFSSQAESDRAEGQRMREARELSESVHAELMNDPIVVELMAMPGMNS